MSKKRGKSASGPSGPSKWETALVSTPLNEEGVWEACTALVLGKHLEDEQFISVLGQSIQGGSRKLFTFITYDDLMKTVMDYGNPKAKKGKDAPANFEVCEPCKVHLDAGEEIPLPLLAKLLKFRLLWAKADDLRRREAEKKAAEGGGKGGGKKGADKGGAKGGKGSAKGKGAGKKEPEPPSVKEASKMFKRGEPDPSAMTIDDEPDDGAQLYIVLTGFTHPQLLPYLAELNACPELVVKIQAQDYSVLHREKTDEQLEREQDEKFKAQEEERRVRESAQRAALAQFWLDARLILQQHVRLRDVALFDYSVSSLLVPRDNDEPEVKAKFGSAMFDDVAGLMYSFLEKRRQWRTYLTHQKLLPVPETQAAAAAAAAATAVGEHQQQADTSSPRAADASATRIVLDPVDMRHYNELLEGIPDESISSDLVLHAVLDQVEAQSAGLPAPSEQAEPQRQDAVNPRIAKLLGGLALNLALTEEEKRIIEAELLPQSSTPTTAAEQPLLLHPHDDISLRTHFLKKNQYFVPKDAEVKLQDKLGPLSQLRPPPLSDTGVAEQRLARLQELLFFCSQGGQSFTDIDHAFKQFVFEYLQLTLTDARGYVLSGPPAETVIPWDDPYPMFPGLRSVFEQEEQLLSARLSEQEEPAFEAAASHSPRPQSAMSQESDSSQKLDQQEQEQRNSGILRRGDSPSRSRASSVHFTDEAIEKSFKDSPLGTPPPEKSIEEVLEEIRSLQMRDLQEFCFAEHLPPHVLLQVLRQSTHRLPYADVYYHQRDSSLFVVLHNPHSQETLSNHRQWHCWLHSNVGLRDYIEHMQLCVWDWMKEMDALYEAQQLNGELEQSRKEEEEAAKKAELEARKGAGGKKGGKATAGGRSRSNSRSRPSSTDPPAERPLDEVVIREGSLKAQKIEQERVQREREEEERRKAEKRTKSAQKKADKEANATAEKAANAKKGGRASAKGKRTGAQSPMKDGAGNEEGDGEGEAGESADQQQFVSYDLGDTLAHVSGEVTNMFPSDGGTIRCERVDFVQGGHSIRTCVFKDDHVISVHVADPIREILEKFRVEPPPLSADRGAEGNDELNVQQQEQQQEQQQQQQDLQEEQTPAASAAPMTSADAPESMPVSYFGSFTARLSDGLVLSLSHYGPDGEPASVKRPSPQPYSPPQPPRDPSPEPEAKGSARGRKGKSPAAAPAAAAADSQEQHLEEQEQQEQQQSEAQAASCSHAELNANFQQVFLSTPDGLLVSFFLEGASQETAQLAVKMQFPSQPQRGDHDASRSAQFEEFSRVITMSGAVVRTMRDGSTQILHSDGSVTTANRVQHPAVVDEDELPKKSESPRKSGKKSKASDFNSEPEIPTAEKVEWTHVTADGQRWRLADADRPAEKLELLNASMATDPSSGEVMFTREDKVSIVNWDEAQVTVVEHADGTRMTSFMIYQQLEQQQQEQQQEQRDAETGETLESEEAVSGYTVQQFVRVECVGFPTVLLNLNSGEVELTLPGRRSNSVFAASPMGIYHLFHSEGGQFSVHEDGTVMYTPRVVPETAYQLGGAAGEASPSYSFRHHADIVCEVVDPDGNVFSVDTSGNSHVMLSGGVEEAEEGREEAAAGDQENDEAAAAAAANAGSLHVPRFFTIRDDGSGTELLRYADVAEYLNEAERNPEAAVLKQQLQDSPNVTAHTVIRPITKTRSQQWTMKYVQDTIVPKGLRTRDLRTFPPPQAQRTSISNQQQQGQQQQQRQGELGHCSAVEFRQILRYPPVMQQQRQQMLERLGQYAQHVLARLAEGEDSQPLDPRSVEERARAASLLSQLAQLQAEAQMQDVEQVYDRATAPAAPATPPQPKPKRTEADWERDRREIEEEMANRLALKRRIVPNYFHSQFSHDFVLSQASDVHSLAKKLNVFPPSEPSSEQASRAQSAKAALAEQQQQQQQQQQQTLQNEDLEAKQKRERTLGSDTRSRAYKTRVFNADQRFESVPYYSRKMPAHLLTEDEKQLGDSGTVIPAYLTSGRPNAQPNTRQAYVEDPVRRKIFTTSVVGSSLIGQLGLRRMRGINALPVRLDFGLLREGCTYSMTLHLVNTGIESCRWRLVAPPPATGIRLLYEPGHIAAGMRREVCVEVYAIAAGVEGSSGIGQLTHHLQLMTETDSLAVPITARIMTAFEYDRQDGLRTARGVKLLSTKPPDRDGIIRPRRADSNVPIRSKTSD